MTNNLPYNERRSMRPIKNWAIVKAEELGYMDMTEFINWLLNGLINKDTQCKAVQAELDKANQQIAILESKLNTQNNRNI